MFTAIGCFLKGLATLAAATAISIMTQLLAMIETLARLAISLVLTEIKRELFGLASA